MSIEIERKFLVNGTSYRTQAYSHYEILQGYIAHENGRSVRVRITDKVQEFPVKCFLQCIHIHIFVQRYD